MDKVFWQSKTFWTQLLGFVVATLTAILPIEYKEIIISGEVLLMAVLTMAFRWPNTQFQGGLKWK